MAFPDSNTYTQRCAVLSNVIALGPLIVFVKCHKRDGNFKRGPISPLSNSTLDKLLKCIYMLLKYIEKGFGLLSMPKKSTKTKIISEYFSRPK